MKMASRGLMETSLPIIGIGEILGVITASSKAKAKGRKKGDVKDDSALDYESKKSESPVLDRIKVAVVKLSRNFLLYAGVEFISRVRQRSFFWILTCTALVQLRVRAFSWNLALYFAIRALFKYLGRIRKLDYLLRPTSLFFCHCIHNNLMVHHADYIEPGYIALWNQTLPQYDTVQDYLNHFSSKVIAEENLEHYQPFQCSWNRLRRIPENVFQSFQKQFPMVVLLYILPRVIFMKKTIKSYALNTNLLKGLWALFQETVVKVIRTSAVLCALPYCLTEFPCVISCLQDYLKTGKTDNLNREVYCSHRRPYLHVFFTSLLSTPVFLAEPKGRLEVMVGYTYWRIFEAFIRKYYLSLEHPPQEEYISPLFTGLTAALSSIKVD